MSTVEERTRASSQVDLEYPIVYNVVTWVRVLAVLGGLGFGLAWNYMTFCPPYAHGQIVFNPALVCVDVLMMAGLAYGIAWAFTARITLYGDRFEQRKPFLRRSIRINDIAGRRYTTGRGAGYPVIVPKHGVSFSMDSTSYGLDERFNRWFTSLPDLQEMQQEEVLERVRNDVSLGPTPEARIEANAVKTRNRAIMGRALSVAALALVGFSIRNHEYLSGMFDTIQARDPGMKEPTQDDYAKFVKAMMEAESMADPLERCLRYPDLPGSHWNAETTRSYCELRNYKTMLLPEIDDLLKQGRAADVDRAFSTYLNTQLHDPGHPGVLDIAFSNAGFDKSSEQARRVIDAWKQQAPHSAFALAASGVQYVDAAQVARGDDPARNVGQGQMADMERLLGLARIDLDRSVVMMPSLTAVYGSMIHLGGLLGDKGYLEQAAARGLQADRYSFSIRIQMMNQSQPQWRRRFGGIDRQRAEDEADASHNPLLRMVAQNPMVYRAYCYCDSSEIHQRVLQAVDKNLSSGNLINLAASVYDSDPRLAAEIYSEALRFAPTEVNALQWRSQQMLKLGDTQGAVESIAIAAHRFPENNSIATQLAIVYRQARRYQESEQTYLAVLKRDPDAQLAMAQLGDLYNHEGHQPEKAGALADTLIERHPDDPSGYIVRACNQMDHDLPGRYETIHYFIDHFGAQPQFKKQVAEMQAYLAKHPEPVHS
jgi:tetratricopeptide (TPR) repeat protein